MFSLDSLRVSGFSWLTALSLAQASKLSYEQKAAVVDLTGRWGFGTCDFLDVGDTQGFAAQTDDLVLFAFRGTESLNDWLGNLTIIPTDWSPRGIVHEGFLQAYGAVRPLIDALLARPGASAKKLWLTGHSLGGVLATIAAGEMNGAASIVGVHTFGQPRLCDSTGQAFFKHAFEDRFFRFVNNDDLVTRVPWNFAHVGKLIHFDSHGNVEQPATEAAAAAVEEPPLSKDEFDRMQNQINMVRVAGRAVGATEGVLDTSLEGLFPSLHAHHLERYIAIISRHAGVSEADPIIAIRENTRRSLPGKRAFEQEGGLEAFVPEATLGVLLRIREEDWKAPPELKVNSRVGTVVSAEAPLSLVSRLEKDPGVASVEVSRDAGNTELTHSLPFIGGDVVHRPPLDERGEAALIGIIDTGADVLHRAFLDGAGKSRIMAVWDQKDATGPSPKGADEANFTQDYGTLYLADKISAFVAGTAVAPEGLRDRALMHGTHVTSIAAGRAVGLMGDGMAPEAGIVVVIPNMKTAPGAPPSLGYSTSHVDALDFLKRVSKGANKVLAQARPMAVNVSLGMNAGAHDGSSTLEAAFDGITGSGRDPGFVVVKSAGNERGADGHVRQQLFMGLVTVAWQSTDRVRFEDYIEAWYDSLDQAEFTLVDPAGNRSAVVSLASRTVAQPLGGNLCQMVLTKSHPDNGASRLVLTITPQAQPIQQGTWTLEIEGKAIRSKRGLIDLWTERDDSRPMRFLDAGDDLTLSIPGTANTVITVAACHSEMPLRLTPSSSFGLTRDERPKPDVCAPGNLIVAARAGQVEGSIPMTGTSMAAPHVTGALALVLSHRQKNGLAQVNARQLQAALVRTAKNFSGLHNSGFGFGMLDAKQLYENFLEAD
jgi:subtilisin family serine protease